MWALAVIGGWFAISFLLAPLMGRLMSLNQTEEP